MKNYLYLTVLLLAGCSATGKRFYTIDGTDYHVLRISEWNKPGITALVEHQINQPPHAIAMAAGNGILNSAVSAAGTVGGNAVFGASLKESSVSVYPPTFIGPLPPAEQSEPPTTIGNDKNDRPFTHKK